MRRSRGDRQQLLLRGHGRAERLQGIKDDFGDFTEIVGDAQPVLAATEQVIKAAAMAAPGAAAAAVDAAVADLKQKVQAATSGALRLSDAEEQTLAIPELHPSATLADLGAVVIGNLAVADWLTPDTSESGVYQLSLPGSEPVLVAFDRKTADQSLRDVSLFSWGTREANALGDILKDVAAGSQQVGSATELPPRSSS